MLTPGTERIGPGALARALEFIDPNRQVAQAGQHGRALASGRATGVLAQRDIAPVMRPVFNRRPVPANRGQHPGVIALVQRQAGRVTTDLERSRFVRCGQVLRVALDRDHLPAAAEADRFRADGDPRDPPTVEPAVAFLPLALRGENPAGRAGVALSPESRSGCL